MHDLHPLIKKIYATRGVFTDRQVALKISDLENPSSLKNIEQAVKLLYDSLLRQDKILIIGDFDADGATSTVLGILCLRAMGFQKVDYLVPNRFEYGYGLTPEIVEVAKSRNPDLIITVDNGIASNEGVSAARGYGIKVLVTDHHLPGEQLPDANCILNPNQPGCEFPSKALAGVGVAFYLMLALRTYLREKSWFEEQQIPEPNMASYLDIVALGTVADVVPLDENNRRLVKHGLNIIRSGRSRPGILALLEIAGRNYQTTVASDLGFAVGPRLNAAGRLDDMSLGIECLLAEDGNAARQMAVQLDNLNKDRKSIEQSMQDQALQTLDKIPLEKAASRPGICLYDSQWHQGVIGILASRIKERFHRPTIVFADASVDGKDDGLIKGSARSIEGLHIRDLLDLIATRNPELLSKFGGHAMAAGLEIRKADFEAFTQVFVSELEAVLKPEMLENKTITDGELSQDCFNLEFASLLREAGPWGQGFPEPCFNGEFSVISQRLLGEKHLKLVLAIPESQLVIDAIAFNIEAEKWQHEVESVDIIYRLDVNEFRGICSPQLMIQDIKLI